MKIAHTCLVSVIEPAARTKQQKSVVILAGRRVILQGGPPPEVEPGFRGDRCDSHESYMWLQQGTVLMAV